MKLIFVEHSFEYYKYLILFDSSRNFVRQAIHFSFFTEKKVL